MALDNLLVFDIETIPDKDHHDGDKFPITPFHQVVAIGFLEAVIHRGHDGEEYSLVDIRCGGDASYDEKTLLQGFFQHFERLKPRLVTYNGRSFDLPVLKYRAMMHGVQAPWLHQGGDRFNNYSYRYNSDWHCDLMDVLSDYNASRAVKLDEVSKLFGFPGKFGIDGSQVAALYEAGEIKQIRDYCETDALNTYLVYLRFMLHCATLTKESYNKALSDLIALIDAEKEKRPHLLEFMEAWGEACGKQFLLE